MKVIVWGVGDGDFVTKCNKSVTESEWSPGKPDSTMEEAGKERCGVSVGEKIKEVRQRAGLAQEAFAEVLEVSRSAVAKWETDPECMPDVANLVAIAEKFDVSLDELLSVRRSREGTRQEKAPKVIIEVRYE